MITCRKCARELPPDALFCCYCGTKQSSRPRTPKAKGNGSGSIYRRSDRPGWCVAYTVGMKAVIRPDGSRGVRQQRRTKYGFKTKREANEWLSALIANEDLRHTKRVPTVAQLYQDWLDAPGKKPGASTLTSYGVAYRKRIEPSIGDLEIDVVSLRDLECIISGLTYDPAKDVKDLMSLLFKRAIGDGHVKVNPVPLLQLPEHVAAKVPAWSPDEISALWTSWGQGNRIAGCCLLMIHSGMMPGELFKCKLDMINWETHTIIGCGLKTKERRENPIVFPPVIVPVLRDLCDTTPSRQGFLLGMNKDKFYDEFRELKKDLGIRPEVIPYSGRHSTATELELLGVQPSIIASVLRHRNYATTAKHYMDIATTHALAALSRIDHRPTDATAITTAIDSDFSK